MNNRVMLMLVLLVAFCFGLQPAQAQRGSYPFFVQPMAVQDVRALADRLELSRDQRRVLLEQYESYNQRFEDLQEGDVQDYMDSGMDTMMRVQPWGGDFQIPTREEVNQLVSDGLRIINAFGRIDDSFFDDMTPLLSESQVIALEQQRRFRALDGYSMLHRNMVGELNDGASPDLIGIMRRVEVDPAVEAQVNEILAVYAKNTLADLRSFESAGKEAIEKLLDEVDARGLRNMDMMAMMQYFSEEDRIEELKGLFDPMTRPMQEKAAAVAAENVRAYWKLQDVLGPEAAREVRRRFVRGGFRDADDGIATVRSQLVRLRELDLSPSANAEADAAMVKLDESWDALLKSMLPVINSQRKFRSLAQLEGDQPLVGEDRMEGLVARLDTIRLAAENVTDRYSDELDLAKKRDAEEEKQAAGGGGKEEGEATAAALKVIRVEPIGGDQLQRIGQWMGADAGGLELMGALHADYETEAMSLLVSSGQATIDQKENIDFDEGQSWREWQRVQSEQRAKAGEALAEIEAVLFEDMALALPESVDRDHINRIHNAMMRSRRRAAMAQDDWSMRRHNEAVIDLTVIILETAPAKLDGAQRKTVMDALIAYDNSVDGPLENLKGRMEKVKDLEGRLWGSGEDYEPEVRQAIRRRWETRREELGEALGELAMLNRDQADAVFDALPHEISWSMRDAYDRQAFPRIFEDGRAADEAINAVMALELTSEQQRQAEDLASNYRQSWRELTKVMVDRRKEGTPRMTFPPSRDSMATELEMAQIRYRRAQLDQRMLAQLELVLDPSQSATIPELQLSDGRGKSK